MKQSILVDIVLRSKVEFSSEAVLMQVTTLIAYF